MSRAAKALEVNPANINQHIEWEGHGVGGFLAVNSPPAVRFKRLTPGIYTGWTSPLGIGVSPLVVINDNLLHLPNPPADRVLQSVRKFWQTKDRYIKYGQLYKRGIMMHGGPGSGKTVTLTFLSQI